MPSSFQRIITGNHHILANPCDCSDQIHDCRLDFLGCSLHGGHHHLWGGIWQGKTAESPSLKVFTILVIIAGVLSGGYTVSGFVQLVAEGEIRVALRRNRGDGIIHPGRDVCLANGDALMLMGHQGDMPNFTQPSAMRREIRDRGATITIRGSLPWLASEWSKPNPFPIQLPATSVISCPSLILDEVHV